MYVMPVAVQGYDAGVELRDVTLAEARAMECNRCGDCCNGLAEGVKKDEATGLPLFVWGSKFPEDYYESRYGQRLLMPIVMGDGGIRLGMDFELDMDGKPHTAFRCSFLTYPEDACSSCGLYGEGDEYKDPTRLDTIRPRNCGEFPVFGLGVDASIVDHGYFVPATGALPRCTWYGIRVTGPWKNTPNWQRRFDRQQQGLPVPTAPKVSDYKELILLQEKRNGSL